MSAYVVDPRHIDYLVSWVYQHRGPGSPIGVGWTAPVWATWEDVPEEFQPVAEGGRLQWCVEPHRITPQRLGEILMAENVRSVRSRYPHMVPGDSPGYTYRPVSELKPDWVVKACDGLAYQSCETEDWRDSLACKILDAIRKSAVREWIRDCPAWNITPELLGEPKQWSAGPYVSRDGRIALREEW